MSGFIIFTLAVLGILVLLGGALMFMYFSGLAGGALMELVTNANMSDQASDPEQSKKLLDAQAEADYWEAFARKYDRDAK